jgi:hypothetical protein
LWINYICCLSSFHSLCLSSFFFTLSLSLCPSS